MKDYSKIIHDSASNKLHAVLPCGLFRQTGTASNGAPICGQNTLLSLDRPQDWSWNYENLETTYRFAATNGKKFKFHVAFYPTSPSLGSAQGQILMTSLYRSINSVTQAQRFMTSYPRHMISRLKAISSSTLYEVEVINEFLAKA